MRRACQRHHNRMNLQMHRSAYSKRLCIGLLTVRFWQGVPRYTMPNFTSILPDYVNAEQDLIRRAFAPSNFVTMRDLPNNLRYLRMKMQQLVLMLYCCPCSAGATAEFKEQKVCNQSAKFLCPRNVLPPRSCFSLDKCCSRLKQTFKVALLIRRRQQ